MKDRHDDLTTDRLLRRAMPGDATGDATPECVDPETLAAWMEGGLPAASLARAEQHASSCARCQAMLASMARTTPAAEPRSWWRTLTASWLVPVAAAATALVLWVAVDRQRAEPPAAERPPQFEQMEAPPPAAASSQDRGAAIYPDATPDTGDDRLASRLQPRVPISEGPPPARLRDGRAAASKTERHDAPVPGTLDHKIAPRDRAAFISTPAPAASASTPQQGLEASAKTRPAPAAPPAVPPPAAPSPTADSSVLAPPAPLAETVTVERGASRVMVQERRAGRVPPPIVEVVSSEPSFRWRIVPPATIQRSIDGGATWTAQGNSAPGLSFLSRTENAASPNLNAASAPAREICWIVGSEGIVLLSTDAISWRRRPFPEPVNLTAVRAVDAKTAVVTTEDGRQFSTADGGATWSKIP